MRAKEAEFNRNSSAAAAAAVLRRRGSDEKAKDDAASRKKEEKSMPSFEQGVGFSEASVFMLIDRFANI